MANYTGDPTATQAPAAAPDPENFPIQDQPADGEALNAASVNQAFKVVADYIAWLKKPRAVVSSWTQMVRRYRDAALNTGLIVDHHGFPGGRIMVLDENWIEVVLKNAAGNGDFMRAFDYRIVGTGPTAKTFGMNSDLSSYPWGPTLSLATGSASPASACVEAEVPWFYPTAAAVSMSWDFTISGASDPHAGASFAMGIGNGIVGDTSGAQFNGGGPAPLGAAIYCSTVGAPITGYASTGTPTNVNTATNLARNTPYRARIDILGTGGSDTGAARVNFFINGAMVTLAMDLSGAGVALKPFFRAASNSGADVCALNVGPVQFRSRLGLGDVAI